MYAICVTSTHQQVFWFDVSVDNVEAVKVFDGTGQIVEHAAGVSLCVSIGRGDGIEQISPLWTRHDGRVSIRRCHKSLVGVFCTSRTDSLANFHSSLPFFFSEKRLKTSFNHKTFLSAQQQQGGGGKS